MANNTVRVMWSRCDDIDMIYVGILMYDVPYLQGCDGLFLPLKLAHPHRHHHLPHFHRPILILVNNGEREDN